MDNPGASAAPAERVPFGVELDLCQLIIDTELKRRRADAAKTIAQSSNGLRVSLSGRTATTRKPMRIGRVGDPSAHHGAPPAGRMRRSTPLSSVFLKFCSLQEALADGLIVEIRPQLGR
jgi:hypothetical protein